MLIVIVAARIRSKVMFSVVSVYSQREGSLCGAREVLSEVNMFEQVHVVGRLGGGVDANVVGKVVETW